MISVSHAVITLFPVIRPNENGKPVAGEIYTVDDEVLERLDRLEGVLKGMYSRELSTSPCLWRKASGCRARRSSMLRALTVGRNTSTACRRTASSMSVANRIGDRSHCRGTCLFDDDGRTSPKEQRTVRSHRHRHRCDRRSRGQAPALRIVRPSPAICAGDYRPRAASTDRTQGKPA
jgi:Gamma-glutamyl cyclotransferase, AIG2-like